MLKLLQKNQDTGAKAQASKSSSVDACDFIPQCEHFDSHTVITKNGELMQTIRISMNRDGLNYEQHDDLISSLREKIRAALMQSIHTDNIAVWIHTLRKRRQVTFDNTFANPFAAYINDSWRKKHGWVHQYFNEVYVTLIYEGQSAKLFDGKLVKDSVWPARNRQFRHTYLDAVAAELGLIMGNVIDSIAEHYQVHLLSISERMPVDDAENLPQSPVYYSEPMEFLSYLLNLREEEVPLPEASICNSLQSTNLMIGFNALETKSDNGKKRFASILSLKNYREVPVHTIDMLLQSPMELIISQAFHFIPHQKALKQYREQRELFEVSGDNYSMQATGLAQILQGNQKLTTDFGDQQTSFMVIVDELKQLDHDVARLQEAFGNIGLVCVREDIKLEDIFWSSFPGNFEFLRRRDPINTHLIGGFARLNRFASGQSEMNLWSQPVALLPTLVNSPYFFNFHVQDNGHTLWLDFNSFNDKQSIISLSFLLSQTQKLHTRLYYFDHQQSGVLWFNKMGAPYLTLNPTKKTKNSVSLNPFSLEGDARNMGFLTAWCSELIRANENERKVLAEAIRNFFANTPHSRSLGSFIHHLSASDPGLAQRFAPWNRGGQFADLFSGTGNDETWNSEWTGFDVSAVLASPPNMVPVFSYLLHRIVLSLDGSPTIIVMRDMLPALSQPFFISRLESLLEMLKENNAIVIFAEHYTPTLAASEVMATLTQNCASLVIVPDDIKQDYARIAPQLLTQGDENLLWHMNRMSGDILLKQKKETVALRINMNGMEDIASIFSNDIKTLVAAGGPFAAIPEAGE